MQGSSIPAGNCMFEVNNRNTRTRCGCSLTYFVPMFSFHCFPGSAVKPVEYEKILTHFQPMLHLYTPENVELKCVNDCKSQ